MGSQNIHPHPPHLENVFWPEMGGGGGGYIISPWPTFCQSFMSEFSLFSGGGFAEGHRQPQKKKSKCRLCSAEKCPTSYRESEPQGPNSSIAEKAHKIFRHKLFAPHPKRPIFGGVPTTPDPNTSAKVSRYKWEPYRDTNW